MRFQSSHNRAERTPLEKKRHLCTIHLDHKRTPQCVSVQSTLIITALSFNFKVQLPPLYIKTLLKAGIANLKAAGADKTLPGCTLDLSRCRCRLDSAFRRSCYLSGGTVWSMRRRLRLRYRVDQGTPTPVPFVHTQAPSTVDKRLGEEIDDGHQKIEPIWTSGWGEWTS